MDFSRIGPTALLVVGLSAVAGVQPGSAQSAGADGAAGSQATQAAEPTAVDVARLPIDVRRIQRQLRESSSRSHREGLNLSFFVDVYGRAPRLQLFTPEDNLQYGPAPWGAPTHNDMLNIMTPREFRSPVMDFNALIRWLADRRAKDSQGR